MKKIAFILLITAQFITACTKVEPVRTSGVDKIDNIVYQSTSYYSYGFSFSTAKLVSNENQVCDIVLFVNSDTPVRRLTFQTNNLKASFFKVGEFADEAAAIAAFDNLGTVSVTTWADWADPVLPNQIWLYRSGTDKYAKIRIKSTINEIRSTLPYGECTFQWVYQPDGSATFPK
jgi:hypothetical protein